MNRLDADGGVTTTVGAIGGLRKASPYIRLFKGKTFVIKTGGAVCDDVNRLRMLVDQIGLLVDVGIRVVLVHGGGPQTTDLSEKLGLTPNMVDGRRVTDEATLEAAIMAINGTVRTRVLSLFRSRKIPAIGLSGIDGGLINATLRDKTPIDFGEVGDVVDVNPKLIQHLLNGGYVPVISPLSADSTGRVLNINADTIASELAIGIGAAKLMFVGEGAGLMEDPGQPTTLISYCDLTELDGFVEQGFVETGMLPKVNAAKVALQGGVPRVHITSVRNDALLMEIFTNEGSGTLMVADKKALRPAELQAGASGRNKSVPT